MPSSHSVPVSQRSLAPLLAQGTLGLLALVQIGLVIAAVQRKPGAPAAGQAPVSLPVFSNAVGSNFSGQTGLPLVPGVPDSSSFLATPAPVIATNPPPVLPSAPPAAPALTTSQMTKAVAKTMRPVLPAGREIKDARIAETVEAAREVRKMGDNKTALDALRKADTHEPNHPEILSEMALTYEAMGLGDKSQAEWHRVAAMGEQLAGGYFLLARSKLDGAPASDAAPETDPTVPKPISLGKCELIRDFTHTAGEKVTLRIPIKPVLGLSVHAQAINPEIYLFDQLSDGRVAQSVAVQSPARWVPAVVDWTNPLGAMVEVDFTLPAQTAEFARTHGGTRKIHGFLVKLYHDYRLMGEQAEPEQLLNFRQQTAAPAGADNALFPRN